MNHPLFLRRHNAPSARQQRGSVLIVSLMILILMTLISVTAMTTSSVEQKMAGNFRDQVVALEAAESALQAGQAYVESITTTGSFGNGSNGLYQEVVELQHRNPDVHN